MMTVLVTGATGFTGKELTRRLLRGGARVKVLVRSEEKIRDLLGENLEVVKGDIRDRQTVRRAVEGAEKIFNIAAMYRTAGARDEVYYDIHVGGTGNIMEAARDFGVGRVVHCSTVGVHGDVESACANEQSPFRPGDVYQKSKLEGELRAKEYAAKNNLALTVIRPTAIYGPGDLRLLKLFRLAARKITPVLGDGSVHYHMIYIDDLVEAFVQASESENAVGETFIIGGGEKATINDLIIIIRKVLNISGRTLHLPARPFQIAGTLCEKICLPLNIEPPIYRRRVDFFTKSRSFDVSRAREVMGFVAQVPLVEGITRTAAWYREAGLL